MVIGYSEDGVFFDSDWYVEKKSNISSLAYTIKS